MGVHFKPGGAFPFLRPPAGALHNVRVSLEHGEDLAIRADEAAHRAQVLGRHIEIDLEPRGPRQAGTGQSSGWRRCQSVAAW